jgi:hypothetical protein
MRQEQAEPRPADLRIDFNRRSNKVLTVQAVLGKETRKVSGCGGLM